MCLLSSQFVVSRRLGMFLAGKCAPYVAASVAHLKAHQLDFADIQRHWGYKSQWYDCLRKEGVRIPTVKEAFHRFAMVSFPFCSFRNHALCWLGSEQGFVTSRLICGIKNIVLTFL